MVGDGVIEMEMKFCGTGVGVAPVGVGDGDVLGLALELGRGAGFTDEFVHPPPSTAMAAANAATSTTSARMPGVNIHFIVSRIISSVVFMCSVCILTQRPCGYMFSMRCALLSIVS